MPQFRSSSSRPTMTPFRRLPTSLPRSSLKEEVPLAFEISATSASGDYLLSYHSSSSEAEHRLSVPRMKRLPEQPQG